MKIKKCKECGDTKTIYLFVKNKNSKDGYTSNCKLCRKKYNKKDPKKSREYYLRKKASMTPEEKEQKNKKRNERRRRLYALNPDKFREKRRLYYAENRVYLAAKVRASLLTKEKRDKRNERIREQRKSDPLLRLKLGVYSKISGLLKSNKTSSRSKTFEYIGCDLDFLKKHLESQFTKGMCWNNYGKFGWHVDHIIPLSSAKTKEDLLPLLHYTNLRPLWWRDNIQKRDKILNVQIKLTI